MLGVCKLKVVRKHSPPLNQPSPNPLIHFTTLDEFLLVICSTKIDKSTKRQQKYQKETTSINIYSICIQYGIKQESITSLIKSVHRKISI